MSGRMFLDFDISMVCCEKQSAFKLLYFSLIAREKCTEVLQEFRFIYRTWSYASAIVLGLYNRIKKSSTNKTYFDDEALVIYMKMNIDEIVEFKIMKFISDKTWERQSAYYLYIFTCMKIF